LSALVTGGPNRKKHVIDDDTKQTADYEPYYRRHNRIQHSGLRQRQDIVVKFANVNAY